MGKYNENEDIIYCGECCAVNKKSAHICCECKDEIRKKHSPYKTFLENHLKSEIEEKITGSLFNLMREFILSHFYGTVLTISVVATVAVSAVTVSSYSKPVNISIPLIDTATPVPEPEPREPEITKESPTWEFLGKTLGELKEIWGTNYQRDTIGGSIYFQYPEGASFFIPFQSGETDNSKIFIVSAYDGIEVLPGITGNSTFPQVQAALPDKELVMPDRTYNEMDEVYEYYLHFDYEGHDVTCVWEEDPATSEMRYIQVE